MSAPCGCMRAHTPRKVVLTGGPGAGKTAVLELIRHSVCDHVHIVQESAGILFGGGFPRHDGPEQKRAAQRAIFYVQRELEAVRAAGDVAVMLCDRGTVDGVAYWTGPGELFESVGTTLEEQLARYAAVIHLRTPLAEQGYNHRNPLRIETAEEARAIDERILATWAPHPRRVVIEATHDFLTKAHAARAALRAEIPVCCRGEPVSET
jgi:predicted ATPase